MLLHCETRIGRILYSPRVIHLFKDIPEGDVRGGERFEKLTDLAGHSSRYPIPDGVKHVLGILPTHEDKK